MLDRFARKVLRPLRFFTILLSMFAFLATMSVVWIFVRGRWRRVQWSNWILKAYSRWGLWVLNVRPRFLGLENIHSSPNGLFVGNHLSYLDILVIHSEVPTCFVTSMEIKETPVLGQVCQLAGCLFIERRNKQNLRAEVSEISEGLREGLNVAIFPEATSTNGEQILRFRRPLYLAAIMAEKPVIPFCLNYRSVGGEAINVRTRDKVFWYGDMDFAPHLWELAGCGGCALTCIF
ncbi:MAG: 1-acyl-sn-glycerol-3-phosphate acyltransferase [Calothrix sp. SM1_5_4]|nr:1-acyl-sn-glycerol-3-phosphate acyltransferase [Calothrix sp. SM1_5_4]